MQTPGRFGVEIEMNYGTMPKNLAAVANTLLAAGINAVAESYNHGLRGHWKVTTDASVDGGCEVVSPILHGEAGLAEMKRVCEALSAAGAKVDKTCGIHIHFDTAGWKLRDFKRVLKAFCANERGLDMLVAPSRRGSANRFCKSVLARFGATSLGEYDPNALVNGRDPLPLIAKAYERIGGARSLNQLREMTGCEYDRRYHKLNLESVSRHGTIEFRQHQGSLNGEKIERWTRLLTGLVNKARSSRGLRGQRTDRTSMSATIWRLNRMSGGTPATYASLYARAKELAKAEGRTTRRTRVATPAAPAAPVVQAAEGRAAGCEHGWSGNNPCGRTPIALGAGRVYCELHCIVSDIRLDTLAASATT